MAINPNLFAGLGPFAGLTQASTEALSRGIGGLFGIKDPELERNRVLSQVDYNDPASLQAAAQELARAGYVDQAVALAGQGRQIAQQERQFGLQERQFSLQERKAGTEEELQRKRIELSEEEIKNKKEELRLRSDLTNAQVDKIYSEIESLSKGDYSIREQKGPAQETISFIAINNKPPFDQKIIPVTPANSLEATGKPSVVPPRAAWQYVPGKGMVKNEDK
jgi:hypothetical protein